MSSADAGGRSIDRAGSTAAPVVLVRLDWQTSVVTFHRADGTVGTARLQPLSRQPGTRVRVTSWSPPAHALLIETSEGDSIAWETSRFDSADQLDGRVVVYLDQNKWRDMSDADRPSGLAAKPAERQAALELRQLVENRQVVLPLSAGHHMETTKWGDDERRYRLGLTTMRLSRGWQLRDPLQLRRDEVGTALLAHIRSQALTPPGPAITLRPDVTSREQHHIRVPAHFTPEQAHAMAVMTHATTIASVLLDREQIPPREGRLRWVDTNRHFSDWLAGETQRSGPQKRRSVDALLFADLSQEIAEEAHRWGLRPDQMSAWNLGPMFADMAGMASLGLYRAVLQERHLNPGTPWGANDLTDMVYLSAGAGYTHVVVAERHATAMLRQAQRRLGRTVTVHSTLQSALPAIRALTAAAG